MKPTIDIKEPFVYVHPARCHKYVKVTELAETEQRRRSVTRGLWGHPTVAKLCHFSGALMASHKSTSDRKKYNCSMRSMDTCDVSGLTVMIIIITDYICFCLLNIPFFFHRLGNVCCIYPPVVSSAEVIYMV